MTQSLIFPGIPWITPRAAAPFPSEADINTVDVLRRNHNHLRYAVHEQAESKGEYRCLQAIRVRYDPCFCLTALMTCLFPNHRRKNRGRRSRKRLSSPDRHSGSTCEPLLASSHHSLASEESCQAAQSINSPLTRSFVTPVKVKRRRVVGVDSPEDALSPSADRAPFRPLNTASNRSRPPFLSPLCLPKKPHDARFAKPSRAMMDIFLDSRARSDMEEDSDDESFRAIESRLGLGKSANTPESPTPPSSRASSQDTDSALSTPTKALRYSPQEKSPLSRSGLYFWRAQAHGYKECPSEPITSPRTERSLTLASQRDGFWKREAERLRTCAPKILLPSWHFGVAGQGDGDDTERLMTLAEVSLTETSLDLDLGPSGHRSFDVSGDRSTAGW